MRKRGTVLVQTMRTSPFFRHVALLMSGTAAAHMITVAATPLLTRLFSPTAYGINAAYLAGVTVIAPMAALRYDLAIVAAGSVREAVLLRALSLRLVVAVAMLTLAGVAFLKLVAGGTVISLLGPLAWLLPLSVLAAGTLVVLNSAANRRQDYRGIVRGKLGAAWVGVLVPLAWLLTGGVAVAGALVVGGLSGTAVAALLLLRRSRQAGSAGLPRRALRYFIVARRYSHFVRYNLVITGVDQLAAAMPLWALNGNLSAAVGAQFALANSILRLPGVLVGQAVGQVMFEHAARLRGSPEEIARMVARIVRLLGMLALLPLAVVVLFGPRMFAFAFGAEWRTAGEYGRWLMPAIAVWFVASPLTLVPTATGRQDVLLRFIVASAVLRLGGLVLGLRTGSPAVAVALLGAAEASVGIGFIWWVYRAAATGRLVSA